MRGRVKGVVLSSIRALRAIPDGAIYVAHGCGVFPYKQNDGKSVISYTDNIHSCTAFLVRPKIITDTSRYGFGHLKAVTDGEVRFARDQISSMIGELCDIGNLEPKDFVANEYFIQIVSSATSYSNLAFSISENRDSVRESLIESGIDSGDIFLSPGASPVVKTDGQKIYEVGPVSRIAEAAIENLEGKNYRGNKSDGRD